MIVALEKETLCHIFPLLEGKDILIIGGPATGKTFLANELKTVFPLHTLIATDDYLYHGGVESLYKLMEDLEKFPSPRLIEGVQGYRLLRKGVQLDSYYPDVVLELFASPSQIEHIYTHERGIEKLKYVYGFNKMNTKILHEYFELLIEKRKEMPLWYKIDNTFLHNNLSNVA